ncbi:MAG: poly(ADP-ribose) glycohydrolase domain-containing protein, partial [Alphaproteobacteria bacterium]
MNLKQNILLGIALLSVSSQALTIPNRPNSGGAHNAEKITNQIKNNCMGLKKKARNQILDHWKAEPSDTSKISKSQAWDKAKASNLLKGNLTHTLPHFSQMDGTAYLFSRLAEGEQGIGMLNAANATRPGGGFDGNGTVQEEMLCALTTLYPNLKEVTYDIKDSIISTKNVKPIIALNSY